MSLHNKPNHLVNERSEYLLQHAYNPVNWFPWNNQTLLKAKSENKFILLSIGYSSCHWCHVMAHESFEDESVAKLMNENFINIKVDREERPDLDYIYMEALQTLNGNGGWPLNIFLTPDLKPFYGGTYFPPIEAFNRPSWQTILKAIIEAIANNKEQILNQAENLTEHLKDKSQRFLKETAVSSSEKKIHEAFEKVKSSFDHINGGFGMAPKFPMVSTLNFLLSYSQIYKNNDALDMVTLTVKNMLRGGMYDQLQGGFSRYSTDDKWLVPHFEKMLYDNAGLLKLMAHLFMITKDEEIHQSIIQTVKFIEEELTDPEGGFYASIDADSNGTEGEYYVWSMQEIISCLQEESSLIFQYFDISDSGNWEGKNILRLKDQLVNEEMHLKLDVLKEKLLSNRKLKIKPNTDKKIILSWNAMMCSAMSAVYKSTLDEDVLKKNKCHIEFLSRSFIGNNFELIHSKGNGQTSSEGVLEDYAYLIKAMLDYYTIDFNLIWIEKCQKLMEFVLTNYNLKNCMFSFTPKNKEDVLMETFQIFDDSYASSNAILTECLIRLSAITKKEKYFSLFQKRLQVIFESCINFPTSFSSWLEIIALNQFGYSEVSVIGKNHEQFSKEINKHYLPSMILMVSGEPNENYPMLNQKLNEIKTMIFYCKNFQCDVPFNSAADFLNSILV